jgi:hypothetical protein
MAAADGDVEISAEEYEELLRLAGKRWKFGKSKVYSVV